MQPEPAARFGYCERVGDAVWAEPLNAVTNAAFIVAAVAGVLLLVRDGRRDVPATLLSGLVFAIGVGSFLFHTIPQRWTLLADVVPIQLFAFGYFGLALRRFLGFGAAAAVAGVLALLAASVALSAGLAPLLPAGARGSAGYAAFALALFGVALAVRRQERAARTAAALAAAGLVFAASLTLRSLDQPLCASLPIGTHWLWHLLNAVVLFLLLRAAIAHRPR